MNLDKMISEKKELEATKTNLKIRIHREKKSRGLQIVKAAAPKDKDVKAAHTKQHQLKETALANAELTQRIKFNKAA